MLLLVELLVFHTVNYKVTNKVMARTLAFVNLKSLLPNFGNAKHPDMPFNERKQKEKEKLKKARQNCLLVVIMKQLSQSTAT